MKKSCKNCYWVEKGKKPQYCVHTGVDYPDEPCDFHSYECIGCGDWAMYSIGEKPLCFNCLLDELNIQSHNVTYYYSEDGEYLGYDGNLSETLMRASEGTVKELEI